MPEEVRGRETDGERWARELLEELRASRYAPRAWGRFLHASFARARERRREFPRAHRQALALGATGFAGWAGAAAASPELAAACAGWWLLVALMLDWHLGMLDEGRSGDGLGIANVISVVRLGLAPAAFALDAVGLLAVLLAAGATDVLDGLIARAGGRTTRLGAWLDGSADGLVLGAVAIAAARAGILPWWATALVLARFFVPWVLIAISYFVFASPLRRSGPAPARLPGLVLFGGLALALVGADVGAAIAAVGALASLAAVLVGAPSRITAPAARRASPDRGRDMPSAEPSRRTSPSLQPRVTPMHRTLRLPWRQPVSRSTSTSCRRGRRSSTCSVAGRPQART